MKFLAEITIPDEASLKGGDSYEDVLKSAIHLAIVGLYEGAVVELSVKTPKKAHRKVSKKRR